ASDLLPGRCNARRSAIERTCLGRTEADQEGGHSASNPGLSTTSGFRVDVLGAGLRFPDCLDRFLIQHDAAEMHVHLLRWSAAAQERCIYDRDEWSCDLEVIAESLTFADEQAAAQEQSAVELHLDGLPVAGRGRVRELDIVVDCSGPEDLADLEHCMI